MRRGDHVSRRTFFCAGMACALMTRSWSARAMGEERITPFSYRASDAQLLDLKELLHLTRLPDPETGVGWDQGPPLKVMQALIGYWQRTYDWRHCEAELRQWPQFKTVIDGLGIHFIHVRSRHPNALPIILTHGWPSTVLLFRDVIGPLTDPTADGGQASDAFDVVVPSLPGFGFSDKPTAHGWNAERTARAWSILMERLGYRRYVAQGGDWGAFVTTAMAQQRPAGLDAIHLNFAQTIPDVIPEHLHPDQKQAVDALMAFRQKGSAYFEIQATRPETLGYALADSPSGQAAWLYDIFNLGTGATGNPDGVVARDKWLDEITLFWLTDTAASSARLYLEQVALLGKRNNPGRVDLPVGVSVFPQDLPPAHSWAPLVYPQLFYWNEVHRGGHFAQLEVPELFTEELRRCFLSRRSSS